MPQSIRVADAAKWVFAPADLITGFEREETEWGKLFANPAAERLIRGGLTQSAQTLDGEMRLESILRSLE